MTDYRYREETTMTDISQFELQDYSGEWHALSETTDGIMANGKKVGTLRKAASQEPTSFGFGEQTVGYNGYGGRLAG